MTIDSIPSPTSTARRGRRDLPSFGLLLALLVLPFLGTATVGHAIGATRPNILVVVIDDMGIEYAPGWGVGSNPVEMPNLEALAASGTRYDNFWVDPLCSPTRALLLTGLWGYETGVGTVVQHDGHSLDPELVTLPEILRTAGYATALFGKWHLGDEFDDATPVAHGFDLYEGPLLWNQDPADPSFFDYQWTEASIDAPPVTYPVANEHMNGRVNDAAIRWILQQSGPWFAVIGSPMAHSPFHFPPGHEPGGAGDHSDRAKYRAMLETFDAGLGELLAVAPDTHVIVVSDNGSPPEVADAPFDAHSAKGTLRQGGVRVPCVIRSPQTPTGVVDRPASAVDLFPTILSWAGVRLPDGLRGDALPSDGERVAYAELIEPNGVGFLPAIWNLAASDGRFKLSRRIAGGVSEMFYDLDLDPFEHEEPLDIAALDPEQRSAYDALSAFLIDRVADRLAQ